MRREPTLSHVQRLVRARVCARCPYRTPGTDSLGTDFVKPCESGCPLFMHLPVLREASRQLDPMVGNRPRVLQRLVRRITRRDGHAPAPVRRYGKRVVDLLEQLIS